MQASLTRLLRDILSGGNAAPSAKEALLIPVDNTTSLSNTRLQSSRLFDRLDKAFAAIAKGSAAAPAKTAKVAKEKKVKTAAVKRAKVGSKLHGKGDIVGALIGAGIGLAVAAIQHNNQHKNGAIPGQRPEHGEGDGGERTKEIVDWAANKGTELLEGIASVTWKLVKYGYDLVADALSHVTVDSVTSFVKGAAKTGWSLIKSGYGLIAGIAEAEGKWEITQAAKFESDSKPSSSDMDIKPDDSKIKASIIDGVRDAVCSFWESAKRAIKDWLWTLFGIGYDSVATPTATTGSAEPSSTPAAKPVPTTPATGVVGTTPGSMPARAGGGPVNKGQPYVVNERGGEKFKPAGSSSAQGINSSGPAVFVPPKSGTVVPHGASGSETPHGSARMLDAISKSEGTAAGGGGHEYDSVFGNGKYGKSDTPITQMTINEAIADGVERRKAQAMASNKQGGHVSWNKTSSATGRYQMTGTTTAEMAQKLGMDPDKTKMDKATQDALGAKAATTGPKLGRWEGLKDNPEYMPEARKGFKEMKAEQATASRASPTTTITPVTIPPTPSAPTPAAPSGSAVASNSAMPFISPPITSYGAKPDPAIGSGKSVEFSSRSPKPPADNPKAVRANDAAATSTVGGYVRNIQGSSGSAQRPGYSNTNIFTTPIGQQPAPTTAGVYSSPNAKGATPGSVSTENYPFMHKQMGTQPSHGSIDMRADERNFPAIPTATTSPAAQPLTSPQPIQQSDGASAQAVSEPPVVAADRPLPATTPSGSPSQGNGNDGGGSAFPSNDGGSGQGSSDFFVNSNNRNNGNTAGLICMGSQFER